MRLGKHTEQIGIYSLILAQNRLIQIESCFSISTVTCTYGRVVFVFLCRFACPLFSVISDDILLSLLR